MNSKRTTYIAQIMFIIGFFVIMAVTNAFAAPTHPGTTPGKNDIKFQVKTQLLSDAIIYVSDDNGDDTNDGTKDHPKKTIKAGIDLADSLYDTASVYVAEGTYSISGSAITLREGISLFGGYSQDWSIRNPSLQITTILDDRTTGGSSGYPNHVVYAGEEITANTVIDGFIMNGGGGKYSACILVAGSPTISNNILIGGTVSTVSYGIYLSSNASPIITKNTIHGGHSDARSHGIYASQANIATITYNTISGGNTVNDVVHGIYGKRANLYIANNNIFGGHCVSDQCYSAGIREADESNSTIIDNTINGGTGYRAYGILTSDGSNPKIYNNTIDAGNPSQTAMGIYIKNDDNPRIINNLIFTSGGEARFCIYENDPGSFPGHPNPDSNPGVLRNNNLFDCPNALLSWFDEEKISWHAVTDLNTPITTAEDGEGTMAEWDNISEDISDVLDSEYRFTGDLDSFAFDTCGRNGAHTNFNWGFSIDKDGNNRSPVDDSDTTGWSIGAYEYNSGSPPLPKEDINQDGRIDSMDLQLCINVSLDIEQLPEIIQRADIDGDSEVDQIDVQLIVMRILGFDR